MHLVRGSRPLTALAAAAAVLALPLLSGPAVSQEGRQFPDPATGIREDTPNDPQFDCSEPDDEDAGTVDNCGAIWNAQSQLWGFAPASTRLTAIHRTGPRAGQPMRSGISADAAWKTTVGRPDVPIAILDTGIQWTTESLREQIHLNAAELPARPDADGDGKLSLGDFAGAVSPTRGDHGPEDKLDAEDLIAAYSDGTDGDGNGYVDDIAGWDFFDGDNNPWDASSYSAAGNHGTGRANDAAARGNDGTGKTGVCPRCSIIPVRVWDTFVVSGDNYAMGAAYAADAGAKVIEVALGALSNSPSAQAATRYAYDRGVTLAVVSSDLNTANHNYPTNYNETIEINGTVADTYGLGAAEGNEFDIVPGGLVDGQAPVGTYFRNSNLTQYGAHVHVSAVGDTGSFATGQASGAFGLILSAGLQRAGQIGGPLTPAEVKQIVTLTAEDVDAPDTVGVGIPDPAQPGFDERFGYGRLDLGAAMARVAAGKIPPTVLLRTPRWWQLVDPAAASLPVVADSGSRTPSHRIVVEAGLGVEPTTYISVLETGTLTGKRDARTLGAIDVADLKGLFPAGTDFTAPPSSPNQYAVTLRAKVTDAAGNVGEDRRVVWLHRDATLLPGWPRFVDRGGEASPRVADLDGDARLEVLVGDSGGRLSVLDRTGRDAAFWNGGRPTLAPVLREASPHARAGAYRAGVPLPRGVTLTPGVADLDGDGALEVVTTNSAGIVTAYDRFGAVKPGFPVTVDRALSAPALRTEDYHVKTGFFGAASIGDLDGRPGLEIVAGGLDGRIYAWHADGSRVTGFPASTNSDDSGADRRGAELITVPTLAELDGTPGREIVIAGSEVFDPTGGTDRPAAVTDLATAFRSLANRAGAAAIGGASKAFALDGTGRALPGWPVLLDGLLPDVLPFVGPAHQFAAGDVDGDGRDELLLSNTTGEVVLYNADGTRRLTLQSEATSSPGLTDPTKVLNLFEYAALGDIEGAGVLSAFKGGITLGGIANLALVGQNQPFDHVVQGWELATGTYRPLFPRKVEDFMLLSQPAISDVDGLPGAEVVQGTGLYLIHALNAAGQEADGFPKFTGGWNYAVPAVGDLDGDGDLELVGSTREGYLFAWQLTAPAAGASEWWGAAHDERSTSRYGTDTRPPARVQGLRRDGTTVTWAATGDDWRVGTPAKTVVVVDGVARELAGGATSVGDVPAGARVEVYAIDEAGNRGLGALLAAATAPPEPPVAPPAPDPAPERPRAAPDVDALPATGAAALVPLLGLLLVGAAVILRRRF